MGEVILLVDQNNTPKFQSNADLAILQRFSTNELWIHFVTRICKDCNLSEEHCNELKARKCFDDWLFSCE